jgi:tetratricopeptide (TPR) repeat protein
MRIFLSAVSGQFRDCRQALASDLRATGAEVVVQEDFQQHGRTLLEKLEAYIAGCDRVIALVGDAYGYEPPDGARPAGRPRRSYTQWEYEFAQGERLDGARAGRKEVYVYVATEDYLDGHPVEQGPEHARLQRDFLAAILAGGEDRNPFGSLDGLCRLALRDGFRVRDPARKPINLPFPTLGTLFKGRDAFLKDLRRKLSAGGGRAAAIVARQAIHGLGGVGKTRAALEYAWRYAEDYTALLFVSAPSAGELRARLADLVGVLGIDTTEAAVEPRLAEVLRWLDDHPAWLLILDNVDTAQAAGEAQRLLAALRAGHVLLTSRLSDWGAGVEPLELHVLAEADAVAFLLERTRNRRRKPDDPATAAAIARELDGLALALEQAGAYIDKLRLSFAEYLRRWQERRAEVLRWHDARLMGYPASVAVTWETTFAQLNEPERRLLGVLAWLAPEPIPLTLFESGPLTAAVAEARDALAGLAGYSLARFAAEEDTVVVHRLVQEITRGRTPEADRTSRLQVALNAVNALAVDRPWDVRTWGVWTPLAPHAEAVTRSADAAGLAGPTARLMNALALYGQARGQFRAAEPLYRRALAIDERSYGPDHPEVARDLNNLAGLLQATNRLGEAEPLYRRALAIDERSYGPDHPEVAITLNNLAELLRATNRLGEAEPLYRRALAIDERSYGPDHPAVARVLNNLARLLGATNRLGEAEPLARRGVQILIEFRHRTGHEHPYLRAGLTNCRDLLQALGRTPEQIEQQLHELVRSRHPEGS